MRKYVIGVDVGTGSVKAMAVDSNGVTLATSQTAYPLIREQDDHCELDPTVIFRSFLGTIRTVVQQAGAPPVAIGLSTAMHSVIAMSATNKLLTNAITWADNRARDIALRIRRSSLGEMIYEQTGTPVHAMSPLCKIIWLREHQQDLFDTTLKFISIKEYIWWCLFNAFEADHSIASATGLMDIEKLQWNANALELAGIDEARLSTLVSTNHARANASPTACRDAGITTDTQFIIGGSDGCMANLGSFATDPGIAAVTIGTSGAVRVAGRKPVYNFDAMTFNYRLDTDTFISGGPTNNGGVVLKWYAENLLGKTLVSADDYRTLLNAVRTVPAGCDGLVFLPYLLGERAPIWNSEAYGSFVGIRHHHRQEHFTRAVIEGVSMTLYSIARSMERSGLELKKVHVSGGFVHSPEWLQILADVFRKPIALVNTGDASALGAAYLALQASGMIGSYRELVPKDLQHFYPDPETESAYAGVLTTFETLSAGLTPNIVNAS